MGIGIMKKKIKVEVDQKCYDFIKSYGGYEYTWDSGIYFLMDKLDKQKKELEIKDAAITRLLGYLKELGWERFPNQYKVDELGLEKIRW